MGLIYKISNDINDKIYIGLTTRTLKIRWNEHKKYAGKNNSAIDQAIYEFGIDHFKCELLQDNIINTELHQAERDWIAFYDSYNNGYNLTPGGNGRSLTDIQIQSIEQLYFIEQKSIAQICEALNLPHSTVYHRIAADSRFSVEDNRHRSKKNQYQAIDIYSGDGEYIDTCYSITQAEKIYGINGKRAKECIVNGFLNKGYRLAYVNQPLIITTNKFTVLQFTSDGEFIAKYKGIREAGRKTNIDYTSIVKVCKGNQISAGGYLWYKEINFDETILHEDIKKYKATQGYRKK